MVAVLVAAVARASVSSVPVAVVLPSTAATSVAAISVAPASGEAVAGVELLPRAQPARLPINSRRAKDIPYQDFSIPAPLRQPARSRRKLAAGEQQNPRPQGK